MDLHQKLKSLPTSSGVYLMKDNENNIIYVGKAKNLKRRVNQHFIGKKDIKTSNLVKNIANFDYILTKTELDALMLENNMIKKYQPHYNILLKDDKRFPYIKINTLEDYPTIEITRKIKKDDAKYFGPYFAGVSVSSIVEIIKTAFNIRTCKNNLKKFLKRPCINYSIGLCSAPCINAISKVDYKKQIDKVVEFLNGDTKNIENILTKKMNSASENLNFERALEYREQLKILTRLKEKFTSQLPKIVSQDVVTHYYDGFEGCVNVTQIKNGYVYNVENYVLIDTISDDVLSNFIRQYYENHIIPPTILTNLPLSDEELICSWISEQRGKKTAFLVPQKGLNKLLVEQSLNNAKEFLDKALEKEKRAKEKTIGACERLKEILKLKSVPYRMECYDISHVSGTNKVASMVVFVNGEKASKQYRKFNIKFVEGNNDFACLQETIFRRIEELKSSDDSFSKIPNLFVIDGGKGQLSSVKSIMDNFNLDTEVISLAKQNEEIFTTFSDESIVLNRNDLALKLLQSIRDEAHRFAITFHRNKRAKTMIKSELDNVKGLGIIKKTLLFDKFRSIENIKNASVQELMLCKGINENLAKIIKNSVK